MRKAGEFSLKRMKIQICARRPSDETGTWEGSGKSE